MAQREVTYYRLNDTKTEWDEIYFKTTSNLVIGLKDAVVNLDDAQTISGIKTFNDGIIIPGQNSYIDLGRKDNWFWTRFSGENWTFNNTYTGSGWARNLMEMKDGAETPNTYFRIGAQGNGQNFTQMYIGPAYNDYWLSLNNDRALFRAKPQYASDPTVNNDLTRKYYVDTKLNTKVDKVEGKGLSTNDYTTTEKTKLGNIASGAEVNVQSDWNVTNSASDAFIKNKPTNLSDFTNDSDFATRTYVDSVVGEGTWVEVYGGLAVQLSETTYTILELDKSRAYYNRPMMMEIRVGSTSVAYTHQIVTFRVGDNNSTATSKTSARKVSTTDFDGRYLKTISFNVYVGTTGTTNQLRVGHVKTLVGNFTGTSGTLTWTTEASDDIKVYIGRIWVLG